MNKIAIFFLTLVLVHPSYAKTHLTKADLIGAWRLVKIEYVNKHGPIKDSFYQLNQSGLIIYDASGWMSVQIAAPHRKSFPIQVSRVTQKDIMQNKQLKSEAYDTYYAYFGTWEIDAQKNSVIHHVKQALIPGEMGVNYSQEIHIKGKNLIFINRSWVNNEAVIRRKIWVRL